MMGKTSQELLDAVAGCPAKVSLWRHYRGGYYRVEGSAVSEALLEPLVLYTEVEESTAERPAPALAIYKDIPGFEGYRAGDDGSIWSNKSGSWRPVGYRGPKGRTCVGFRVGRKTIYRYACHLVLLAFVGPCPPGRQCCHADDPPGNDRLSNLRWDTPKANSADAATNGKTCRGSNSHHAKLNEESVKDIIAFVACGHSRAQVARMYGVSQSTVSRIISGKKWKHCVAGECKDGLPSVTFARPLSEWRQAVEYEGKTVPRFSPVVAKPKE
jgi:hypothetical protein